MANFDQAVQFVLDREGGLSDANPSDAGGITNFGISLRFLRTIPLENLRRYSIFEPIDEQTIINLTEGQAKFIYRGEFWNDKGFEGILDNSVCSYIFDMCVCFGHSVGIKMVQRALCAAMLERGGVRDDGILGNHTIELINFFNSAHLMRILVAVRESYYRLLAELKPSDKDNLNGWLNRAYRAYS